MFNISSTRKGCFLNSPFLYLLLSVVLVSSCNRNDRNTMLTKNEWHIKNTVFPNASNTTENPYTLVKFYTNNRYIIWSGNSFTTGLWNWDGNKAIIILKPTYGEALIAYWKIDDLSKTQLVANVYRAMTGDARKKEMTLIFLGNENRSDKDPYSVTANLWRKNPDKLETDAALKNRVKSYLQFLEMVYKHAVDNNETELDFSWYPQPLRMQYSNGVRMAYNDELDDWNKCFFDSAQSVQAYQLIGGLMYEIKVKKSDNLAKRNLDFVQQMIRQVK